MDIRSWCFPFARTVVPRAPALDHPSFSSISVHQSLDGRVLDPASDDVVVVIVPVVIPNAVDVVVVVDAHASVTARSRSANATNVARRGGGGLVGGNDDVDKAAGRKEERRRTADADVADVTTIAVVAASHEDDAGRRGCGGCDVDCHRRGAS